MRKTAIALYIRASGLHVSAPPATEKLARPG